MFDWSDLRHLLAVSRHGSTLAAAKALGVNQSTVHLRIAALEGQLGLMLVKRHPTGYRLSELGETLIDPVLAVETAVEALKRQLLAFKNDLWGVVRLTCPEPTVSRIVASGLLDRFYERNPDFAPQPGGAAALLGRPHQGHALRREHAKPRLRLRGGPAGRGAGSGQHAPAAP